MWVLSLFSGLGGQCEAFVNHPLWRVIRIEINEKIGIIPHTRFLDVNEWMDWLPDLLEEMGGPPDLIIAAPPCDHFSTAFSAPRPMALREGLHFDADMVPLESTIDIIQYCQPKYHIIECVRGARKDFFPYVGSPSQMNGPFVFWGNYPAMNLTKNFRGVKAEQDTWSDDPLRKNKKAKWPLEISEALLESVMTQSSLADWC